MVSATKAEPKKPEKKKSKMAPASGNGTDRIRRARKWDVSDRDWARYHKYRSPEIRQDLLKTPQMIQEWAALLCDVLDELLDRDDVREIKHF